MANLFVRASLEGSVLGDSLDSNNVTGRDGLEENH